MPRLSHHHAVAMCGMYVWPTSFAALTRKTYTCYHVLSGAALVLRKACNVAQIYGHFSWSVKLSAAIIDGRGANILLKQAECGLARWSSRGYSGMSPVGRRPPAEPFRSQPSTRYLANHPRVCSQHLGPAQSIPAVLFNPQRARCECRPCASPRARQTRRTDKGQ